MLPQTVINGMHVHIGISLISERTLKDWKALNSVTCKEKNLENIE